MINCHSSRLEKIVKLIFVEFQSSVHPINYLFKSLNSLFLMISTPFVISLHLFVILILLFFIINPGFVMCYLQSSVYSRSLMEMAEIITFPLLLSTPISYLTVPLLLLLPLCVLPFHFCCTEMIGIGTVILYDLISLSLSFSFSLSPPLSHTHTMSVCLSLSHTLSVSTN